MNTIGFRGTLFSDKPICEHGEHMLIHKPEEDCNNAARSQLDKSAFKLTSWYLLLMLDRWVLDINCNKP